MQTEKEKGLHATEAFDCRVIRTGFKPVTYCLEGSCSIQLSYRTV